MLPFSPISEALLPPAWVAQQWPVLQRTRTDGWDDLVAANQAIVDPAGAWAAALNCSARACWGAGTTLADTLYWIATRPANRGGGRLCTKRYPPAADCGARCCAVRLQVRSQFPGARVKLGGRLAAARPRRGWNVLLLSADGNTPVGNASFDSYADPTAEARLVAFLRAPPASRPGAQLVIALQDTVAVPVGANLTRLLTAELGVRLVGRIGFRSGWAFAAVRGWGVLGEAVGPPPGGSSSSSSSSAGGL